MITYAVDFETFYSDECSVRTLGNRGYFSHPDFDAYMVSVVGSDGYEFCGHPKEFDWTLLAGNRVLSHNAAFDETLYLFGAEHGWYPKVDFAEWHCTADLCAYFNIPRSLKGAVKWIWKEDMPKTTRDNMKNRRWELMTPEFKAEVTEYALKDSRYCLRVWDELEGSWPEQERWLSCHTRRMMRRGLPMDSELLRKNLQHTKRVLFDAEAMIPWAGEKPLLSPKAFAEECRKCGIDPPASLAIDSEEADTWIETYGEQLPWATAVRSWRSVNSLIKKLEGFERGTLEGRYYGGMMYCGAHTRRSSGGGSNGNLQNLSRGELHGINVRSMISAAPGKKLVVVDLSQIEVRTVLWLARDKKALQAIRESPDDIYEAFAVMFGMWTPNGEPLKKVNPELRNLFKIIGLGSQFGASAAKIASISGQSLEDAEKFTALYRKNMKSVVRLWKDLNNSLTAARKDGFLELMLPSGNRLIYRDVAAGGGRSTTATLVKNGSPMTVRLWFGSLIENCLAASTEVLTELRGWQKIVEVRRTDRVWDGEEFVTHDGCAFRGNKETIECHSVVCTPDHQFLVGSEWIPAEKARHMQQAIVNSRSELPSKHKELDRSALRVLHSDSPTRGEGRPSPEYGVGTSVRLRERSSKTLFRGHAGEVLQQELPPSEEKNVRGSQDSREILSPTVSDMGWGEAEVPRPKNGLLEALWGSWNFHLPPVGRLVSKFLRRHGGNLEPGARFGPNRQQRKLLPREYSVGNPSGERPEPQQHPISRLGFGRRGCKRGVEAHTSCPSKQRVELGESLHLPAIENIPEPVYDLLNCGPRNRFVVRAGLGKPTLIAHNCAQALARDIFMDCVRRIEDKGYPLILHVHDEAIVEIDEESAQQCLDDCIEIMSTPPAWISDIPLSAEGKILDRYEK